MKIYVIRFNQNYGEFISILSYAFKTLENAEAYKREREEINRRFGIPFSCSIIELDLKD